MLFSSMIFLWVFFIVVIGINYLFNLLPFKSERLRIRFKNIFLLAMSFLFYAWGGIYYLLIMVSSILLNFAGGYLLEKGTKTPGARRAAFVVVIILNIAILFFFKYFNMLIAIIESLIQPGAGIGEVFNTMISMKGTGQLGLAHVVLPIGISFFTFQSMSYVMDVYMGKSPLQENVFDFALYVSLFPQLIAGPIVKYSDVDLQIRSRKETLDLYVSGQKRFCYGLAKKVLISNTVAKIADDIWALDTSNLGAAVAWLGILAYTLQIYYDFSGYSDMAIGIGRMLGFKFKENFDYPYTSLSVQEFWRRWHISLSTWFKEYIYIPLGGNRKGNFRTYFNVFIVFLLTGIWHGANFTFIAWGLFYAVLQIIERLFLGKLLKKNPIKIINWIYTMLAVMIGWVYFRSDNIFQANEYVKQLFNFNFTSGMPSAITFLSMNALIVLVVGVLLSGFVQRPLKNVYAKICTKTPVLIADFTLQFVLVAISILMLISGTYNPFIYFQF
jgi:alginate O-acetyltransferase complex protein AlgI